MLTRPSLTLKERSKVKSDITKRFAAYGFLKVVCTLETSGTNNKPDRDTFVKNANSGDGDGSKSETINHSNQNYSQTVPKTSEAILKILEIYLQ